MAGQRGMAGKKIESESESEAGKWALGTILRSGAAKVQIRCCSVKPRYDRQENRSSRECFTCMKVQFFQSLF